MPGRTIVVGDIHGDLAALELVLARLPELDAADTLLFLGDYVDRGPDSAGVVARVRALPRLLPARVVALRGNHEDAWLRIVREGWPEYILTAGNGCLATYGSYTGKELRTIADITSKDEFEAFAAGHFLPQDDVAWMASLPTWYEDYHAIYVHAGLPHVGGRWLHPSEVDDHKPLMWQRSMRFFSSYEGKRVVFGHTSAEYLPQEVSLNTPDDEHDLFVSGHLIGVDTGSGRGGFLTAVELPSMAVYESR